MTFSTWEAMTLRWVNSEFWKRLRMSRSVSRCWINISSTWAVDSSGLSDARQTVMKTAKASRNLRFFSWASRMCSLREWARSGMRLLNSSMARWNSRSSLSSWTSSKVGSVLSLPPAAGQAELVADGAIWHDTLAPGVSGKLRDQGPAAPFGGFIEQVLERSLETQFVGHGLALEML